MKATRNGTRTFLSAKRSRDFPVPCKAGWKTRPPVIEAEARETDKTVKEILVKIGV